jgi:hypothetical protein
MTPVCVPASVIDTPASRAWPLQTDADFDTRLSATKEVPVRQRLSYDNLVERVSEGLDL